MFNIVPLRFRKAGGSGVVAHERLTEPRVTMEWLLAKLGSFSNLPAFLYLNGISSFIYYIRGGFLTGPYEKNPHPRKIPKVQSSNKTLFPLFGAPWLNQFLN